MDKDEQTLFSTAQVAKRLGVNQQTVQRWLRENAVRGVRLPGVRAIWRIPLSEVERLERGESGTETGTLSPPANGAPGRS